MSGFDFHLECSACGLLSPVFPYLHTSWDRRVYELPAANRETRTFELCDLASPGTEPTGEEVVEAAIDASTEQRQVAVPIPTTSGGIELRPPLACPRCGAKSVEAKLGSPASIDVPFSSIDAAVTYTRTMPEGRTHVFAAPDEGIRIACRRFIKDGEESFFWRVKHQSAELLATIVTPLLERLRQAYGSTCSEPRCGRRYCAFEERAGHTVQPSEELEMPFEISVSGPDPATLLQALLDTGFAGDGEPDTVTSFGDELPIENWRALAAEAAPGLRLGWSESGTPGSLKVKLDREIWIRRDNIKLDPAALVEFFARLPFEIGVVGDRYVDWNGYVGPKPTPGHYPLGLALALKGRGHDRVVSPRWLEYGPWALIRRGDLSVVFFHDPAADATRALEQARLAHRAMGPGPDGGWVHPNFRFSEDRGGLYDAADRELIWVLMGRDPEPWELLELCAVRTLQALGPDKPVERVAVVMPEDDRARGWVHEMWLREIELRTFIDGVETSLTARYEPPPPTPPAWVTGRSWLPE